MPLDGTLAILMPQAAARFAAFAHVRDRWTSADLNYLFHGQQVEHSRAARAASPAARAVHRELARLYEDAIEQVTGGKIRFRLTPARAAALSDGQPGRSIPTIDPDHRAGGSAA